MNIGIDIDDTISETFEALIPYAQKYTLEELGRKPKIDMNQNFLDHLYIEKIFRWNEEEAENFWYKYYADILKNVNIKIFASDVIKRLKQKGNNIYLITARWDIESKKIREITLNWLKENNVVYDKIFMNANDKLKLIKENKVDIFIDDSYKNCKDVSEQQQNTNVYIMNTRMNEKLNIDNVKRVYSWFEIEYLINMKGEN